MSLNAPISIAAQANVITAQLKDWADPKGGIVKVMANLAHLWEELYTISDKPRLLVVFVAEVPRGGFELSSALYRVDREWQVVVTRGHGWKNAHAEALGDTEPFLDTLESLREKVRVLLNISEERPLQYEGMRPLPSVAPSRDANMFMDAQSITFKTANDIPAITDEQT